ncbi:Partner of Y14 and mago [Colletotrichum chlorophyti]|uniref:Partner of Y14 and mago n=1 Tax=Colletotrichum chlorophyti TaxID=708187 RepID=A0A1Q8RB60_9PEZI|nr:Partner of Y14 and mago [Colletotrichum chlorophyti]
MPSEPTKASNAGIITDDAGERQIPESKRADGSTRKAIKIRPGYRPPEDVEVYKNRTAAAFRDRATRVGIPGAASNKDDQPEASSAASNKNAKRREARKKAKAVGEGEADGARPAAATVEAPKAEELDSEVEREKKARNLKKKLKQAKDLKNKKEGGETLLPEQIAKVIKINELIRELDALGFDAEGEPKAKAGGERESTTKDEPREA